MRSSRYYQYNDGRIPKVNKFKSVYYYDDNTLEGEYSAQPKKLNDNYYRFELQLDISDK